MSPSDPWALDDASYIEHLFLGRWMGVTDQEKAAPPPSSSDLVVPHKRGWGQRGVPKGLQG